MTTAVATPTRLPLDCITVGQNARELDQHHVDALASSIELRGLIVPLVVRADGERFVLVAGHHRHAACRKLGLADVEVTVREQEGTSADSAAENVVRKALSPLEEARAVQHMLDEGYTLDGAATILGWSRNLVGARAKILELPESAQRLLGSGELPVSAVAALLQIAEVSPELCEAAVLPVADGAIDGEQLAHNPGWAIGFAIREDRTKAFAAYLTMLDARDIAELRLGKKTQAAYDEAEAVHRQLDRYAYGPPPVRFSDPEVDQARAAGVLIEFDRGTPIIADRALFRELAKQAIERTRDELRTKLENRAKSRTRPAGADKVERTPQEELDAEHRAAVRTLTARAHGANLDLGTALLNKLATVDANDIDVARFFVYGLLGPDERGYLGAGDHTAMTIAANGIRLVFEQHRTTTTPTLKSGKPGVTKVQYGEVDHAAAWLWKFVEGGRTADELYGRALVVFAAQHYAHDLALPRSARRSSALPRSRKDTARKAFERLTKDLLPATHVELRRALEREARRYAKRKDEIAANERGDSVQQTDVDGSDE
jgi:ParB/RepB/Spo0J family partition protein